MCLIIMVRYGGKMKDMFYHILMFFMGFFSSGSIVEKLFMSLGHSR